jgi:hypothetical protein
MDYSLGLGVALDIVLDVWPADLLLEQLGVDAVNEVLVVGEALAGEQVAVEGRVHSLINN